MVNLLLMKLHGIGKRKSREYELFNTIRGKCDTIGYFETKDSARIFANKKLSGKNEGRLLLNSEYSNELSWKIEHGKIIETDLMVGFHTKMKAAAFANKPTETHSAEDVFSYVHHVYDSPARKGVSKMRFTLDGSPLCGGAKEMIAQIQHECEWKGLTCYISEAGNILHKSYAFVITGNDAGIAHIANLIKRMD